MIAPSGNPPIRLDLRLLDRVELGPDDETDGWQVQLSCGELDGREAAQRIVREAAPHTRDQTSTQDTIPVAPVETALPIPDFAAHGKLVVLSSNDPESSVVEADRLAGTEFQLQRPDLTIGRTDENEIVIVHRSISRNHARVTRNPETGRYTIRNLEYSKQGANLPIAGGSLLQAAIAMLVVAAAKREITGSHPWLGIRIDGDGPQITEVIPGAAGDRAGVRTGDELVSIAVASTTKAAAIDNPIMLRLRRSGKLIELAVMNEGPQIRDLRWTTLPGCVAPAFTVTKLDGSLLSLHDLAGRVVVLDFWATDDDLPKMRLPRLSALHDAYPELRVVGVSPDDAVDIERVAASKSLRYLLVSDGDRSVRRRYLIAGPPMLVIIDKEGIIRRVEFGVVDFDALEAELVKLMQ